MSNATFTAWIGELDQVVMSKIGMSYHDLPDLTMVRDLFDDGCTPAFGAECVLDEAAADDPMIAAALYG